MGEKAVRKMGERNGSREMGERKKEAQSLGSRWRQGERRQSGRWGKREGRKLGERMQELVKGLLETQ